MAYSWGFAYVLESDEDSVMAKGAKKAEKTQDKSIVHVASNRRVFHDYHVLEQFEGGLELLGTEVKSLRQGHCQLQAAHAHVDEHQDSAWLVGANIPEYSNAGPAFQHEPQRKRKILLRRKEIEELRRGLTEKGTTLMPLKIYFKKGWAKVQLGLCRGKKLHDKREDKKAKDVKREIARYKER